MPDIFDLVRGLKIGLTDEDYEDYQNGNLSDDLYARRRDGSIANRVDISPLDNDIGGDTGTSGGFDPNSAAIGALVATAILGASYGIKKLWDKHKKKKAEAQKEERRKPQVNIQKEERMPISIERVNTMPSAETAETKAAKRKTLTQEEAVQELLKIIVGMAEIAEGKKKVLEGVENLSNAGIVDRVILLEKLSDPKVLEDFNAYLEKNPQFVMQNQTTLSDIFGRNISTDGQYVPLAVSDIEQQLNTTIQED